MKPLALDGQRREDGLTKSANQKPRGGRQVTFQGVFNGAVCVAFVIMTVGCAGLFCRMTQMETELQDLRRACTPMSDGGKAVGTTSDSPPDGPAHLPQEQNNNNRQAHSLRRRDAEGGPTESPKRRKRQKGSRRRNKCQKCKGKKGDAGPPGPPGARGPAGPAGNFTSTFAHFKSSGGRTALESATLNNWILADWANEENFPVASSGEITVEKPGIYFIYSQIVFYEKHHLVSYQVCVDGSMYLTCNESVENVTTDVTGRYKTCYVAGLAPLQAGARVEVRLPTENMFALLFHDTTYLGLIKVAELPST
ncbi:ectodysplasin-A-like [Branchiostoma floridae]|uniref:Ectodysplasin-A-like n=1 Tax=Branchiostoma floridae TaxID=7739 RepID=A0A9J7M3G4_BRAFL|nr:ectodysplasin-A-like [Branchiostoma floridae]